MNNLDTVNKVIEGAKQYDGNIYLTTIIVVGILLITFMYIWYIQIPNMTAIRENNKRLVEAVASIVYITGATHKIAEVSSETLDMMNFRMERVILVTKIGTRILYKLSRDSALDVSAELAEIKGCLNELNKGDSEDV